MGDAAQKTPLLLTKCHVRAASRLGFTAAFGEQAGRGVGKGGSKLHRWRGEATEEVEYFANCTEIVERSLTIHQ